ncbi:MAG TPA: FAD-linked oxidase C-terminal domain-containing protein [Terriglobales bacterium]|nr:FAD-linked oxidase C-terminal domain-containing protein [Terriglobales bacterium]
MRLSAIRAKLTAICGSRAVLHSKEDLLLYEYDAGLARARPDFVVFPSTTEQVAAVVALANESGLPVVARGAGTGLSGGAIPRSGGIVLAFARMNRILEVDVANQRAVVQPGVVNLELSEHVRPLGFYFAPDPSSQKACTIGGNVAENSGGPHTLASGVTVNHVTGLEVVLADGRIVELGGKSSEAAGYDLTGFFVGSEGTLGITTKIMVKLTRVPEHVSTLLAIYNDVRDAGNTVVEITSAGITPAALEMMDGWTLRAVEAAAHAGYPQDAAAVLLIELEGLRETVDEQVLAVEAACARQNAREVRIAQNDAERQRLWYGRKNAFAAIGRISPSYYTQDGVIPRTRIPQTLEHIQQVAARYSLTIGNVFHAGDGNLHPLILFDDRSPAETEKSIQAGKEILQYCISVGGSLTGEHGVGIEKRDLMPMLFSDEELQVMRRLREALNPRGTLNPEKLIPGARTCMEIRTPQFPGVVS